MTGSSKTGRAKVAMSRIESSMFTLGDAGAESRMDLMKEVTAGPMRTARVEPMMRAIFLVGRVGFSEAMVEVGLWVGLGGVRWL